MLPATTVLVCPSCRASLRWAGDANLAGKKVRCPKCKNLFAAATGLESAAAKPSPAAVRPAPVAASPATTRQQSDKFITEPAPAPVDRPAPAKPPVANKPVRAVKDNEEGQKRFKTVAVAAVGLIVLAATGSYFFSAGPSDAKQRTVFATEGIVRFRGQPVAGARVMLHPEELSKDRFLPNAITGTEGTFKLTTYQADDGAPAGRYKVAIAWNAPKEPPSAAPDQARGAGGAPSKVPQPDRLQNRYSDPKNSGLTAHITTEPPNRLEFDLK